jgi:hypothetical protein
LFGFLFSKEFSLSVISLRIGTVKDNEVEFLRSSERATRTLLSKDDAVNLFQAAIEADRRHGVYYGVSDNQERPWEIEDAIKDISYKPSRNYQLLFG